MGIKESVIKHLSAQMGSFFLVRNEGAYVATFSVSYTYEGKAFRQDSGEFTAEVNKSISVPEGATDICLKVEVAWFIRSWATIFVQNFDAPVTKCYRIWGTTLDPNWEEVSCE